MRPGIELRVMIPQAIIASLRSGQDPHNIPSHLSAERKKHCESLCTEATIDGLILYGHELPVAILSMIYVCRLIINRLNKILFRGILTFLSYSAT